jgi:hypothetical protein
LLCRLAWEWLMTCCKEAGVLQRDLLEVVLLIWRGAVVQSADLIL